MLGYADPQASQLTWDQATKKLAVGRLRLRVDERLRLRRARQPPARTRARTSGRRPFPGTDGSFLAVVDVFVAATKAQNAKNALAFLGGISQPDTQLAFNKAKGSVPVLRDVDVVVADGLPASVLEGLVGVAGAAVDRPRRGDEPGVPGGLLRRRVRPTSGRGARTRSRTTSRTRSPRTSSRRAKPDRRCRAYQAKCVTGRAKRLPSELVVGQIAIDGSSERRRVSGSGARSGRAVEASRADAAHSHNVGEIRGPHTTELAQRRSRIRVNWALAAGTWQRVTPRSRAVRGPPQAGMRHQWRPMSRLWLRRPLPASCAIGWACPACDRALIDAQVRHHRRRQAGEHFRLRQPGLQVMDDGAQEP